MARLLFEKAVMLHNFTRGRKEGEIDAPIAFAKNKSASADAFIYLHQFLTDERFQSSGHRAVRPHHLGGDEEPRRVHLRYFSPNLFFHFYAYYRESKLGIGGEFSKGFVVFLWVQGFSPPCHPERSEGSE